MTGVERDGLHQYLMYLYNGLVSEGHSPSQASAMVYQILLEEMKYFGGSTKEPTKIEQLEQMIQDEADESKRFKLIQELEKLKS
jgi:hypothetical protein